MKYSIAHRVERLVLICIEALWMRMVSFFTPASNLQRFQRMNERLIEMEKELEELSK
jgi:hypothetical protein